MLERDSARPRRSRLEDSMKQLSALKKAPAIFLVCAATAIASPAQTFTTLATFDGTNGANPYVMTLLQSRDGNFYGTTSGLGGASDGTIFSVTPAGALTTLYTFCAKTGCSDGKQPYAGLILGSDGNFYGTTHEGGTKHHGTVYTITPAGERTTLYNFCSLASCADGWHPHDVLIQGANGNFYGTTKHGGANADGTIFEITPKGSLRVLHSFDSTDGAKPTDGLILATDGNFYGTTGAGGDLSCQPPTGCGTIFRITPAGVLTTLYTFSGGTEGETPVAGLIQASNGNFYGTTQFGGAKGQGTVFQFTSGGALTTLYTFYKTAGAQPTAGLIQATDGNLYGTTGAGGDLTCHPPIGCGTIFEITLAGVLTTLHSFDLTDGQDPAGGLVQATNGSFYGTTYVGGPDGDGTVFSLSTGLGPFVRLQHYSGKAGQTIYVVGQGFTGTTGVSFNGTPATFAVLSDTFLTTSVPAGATIGAVTVATPSGQLLSSDRPFQVTP
jgi:uncharacterized repeat protein (TIGR03803 family)